MTQTNKLGQNILHIAAINGQHKVIPMILKANLDPTVQDSRGMTALHFSAMRGDYPMGNTLITYM